MPGMTGTELLREVRALHPGSRKVLLTAYADSEAAIRGINDVGLDHYLMKPWDPPEQHLYPVLDDLLADWAATFRPPFEGIRVAGSRWSPRSHELRDFLSRTQTPYAWIDLDDRRGDARPGRDAHAGTQAAAGRLLSGRHVVAGPHHAGAGRADRPADRSAAAVLRPHRRRRRPERARGRGVRRLRGSADHPDRAGCDGRAGRHQLADRELPRLPRRASPARIWRAGRRPRRAASAPRSSRRGACPRSAPRDPYRVVALDDGAELKCYALLLATGMQVRRLEVPRRRRPSPEPASTTARRSRRPPPAGAPTWCIVGGANSAGQAALLFARYARTVTMLVRGESLQASMSTYLIDRIEAARQHRGADADVRGRRLRNGPARGDRPGARGHRRAQHACRPRDVRAHRLDAPVANGRRSRGAGRGGVRHHRPRI